MGQATPEVRQVPQKPGHAHCRDTLHSTSRVSPAQELVLSTSLCSEPLKYPGIFVVHVVSFTFVDVELCFDFVESCDGKCTNRKTLNRMKKILKVLRRAMMRNQLDIR